MFYSRMCRFSLLILLGFTLSGCATQKIDPMDIAMAPITLPGDIIMLGAMAPALPFALAYEATKENKRSEYKTSNQNYKKALNAFYPSYSKNNQKQTNSNRRSLKASDRVWKEY